MPALPGAFRCHEPSAAIATRYELRTTTWPIRELSNTTPTPISMGLGGGMNDKLGALGAVGAQVALVGAAGRRFGGASLRRAGFADWIWSGGGAARRVRAAVRVVVAGSSVSAK